MSAVARRGQVTETEETTNKETSINMRVDTRTRDLIDLAAKTLGRSRTDFVLESALASAHNALLDRCLFPLESRRFQAFQKALDKPSLPNSKLKELMRRKPVWDEN